MVEALSNSHRGALTELLAQDPVANLFLIGWARTQEMSRAPWYGVFKRGVLTGVALVVPERLAVPWCPDVEDATRIGQHLRRVAHVAGMVIGPREASDALWRAWSPGPARIWYDQRLYVQDTPPPGPPLEGFRVAKLKDLPQLVLASARMEEEDLGRNPLQVDPVGHESATRERIRSGRTWVIEQEGELVFHIHAGTWIREGCQVGGTWVPPERRGRGLGTAGMRELGRQLLDRERGDRGEHEWPARLTLHVNEANTRAVGAYESAGYRRAHAFRLVAREGL